MKLIYPSYEIEPLNVQLIISNIEKAGRTCYKSEEGIKPDSAEEFITKIVARGHESVLEHEKMTVRFICDRGVTHEIVRHRIASFSQESTRYCNYSKDKFDNQLTFIIPPWVPFLPDDKSRASIDDASFETTKEILESDPMQGAMTLWLQAMQQAQNNYLALINAGWQPQQARSVLPNSLKTEIVVTANFREWRTIFKQRTSQAAHPQMRELMLPLLSEVRQYLPCLFSDL